MTLSKLAALALALAACTDTYDYDPATAGDAEGTAREPRSKSSSQFVRAVYADVLGRNPTSYEQVIKFDGVEQLRFPVDEESLLVGTLDGIGDAGPMRNLVVAGLLRSTEVTLPLKSSIAEPRDYIRAQFTRLLGREPNAYELGVFTADWMADPAVGPRTIVRAIMGSREYQSQ